MPAAKSVSRQRNEGQAGLPAILYIDIFKNALIDIDIDIDIFKNVLIDIDIDIDIFKNVLIDIDIFKNVLIDIDIDIFKSDLIDIDIFKSCRYIDYRYGLSIYRTPLVLVDDAHLVNSAGWVRMHCEVGEHNLDYLLRSYMDHGDPVNFVWVVIREVR